MEKEGINGMIRVDMMDNGSEIRCMDLASLLLVMVKLFKASSKRIIILADTLKTFASDNN